MKSEILEIVKKIKSGQTTARAEVEKVLAAAKEKENLHALLEIFPDEALKRADEIDAKIARGENVGRLAGVPYVAKDNFLTKLGHTTAAAKTLENFESPIDATAVERLNNEGAILIGKANLDAFAHGGSTENSAFGATKNAVDQTRVAGGSSGGSAVAVAAGIVPFALGSDTGGSIRQPASFNGVVGYKPTYGMISRYGVVAMASSTDVVGPVTKSVEDAEILCEILAGPDRRDGTLHENFFGIEKFAKKAVIFDFFKVIATRPFLGALLHQHGIETDKDTRIRELILQHDLGQSLDWLLQEINKISGVPADDLRETLKNQPKIELNAELMNFIKNDLKGKYKVGLLSNIGPGRFEALTDEEDRALFDDILLSWEVEMVKPNPEIYKLAAKKLNLKPGECIFVDDNVTNVEAAEKLGMTGVLFDDTAKGIAEIKEALKQTKDDDKPRKIGLIRDFMNDGIDPEVRMKTLEFAEKLKQNGHIVEEVDFPMSKYAIAIYYVVTPAELSSNLARFDGIRYGLRAGIPEKEIADQQNRFATSDSQVLTETENVEAKTLDEVYGKSRDIGFMLENKRRVMIGAFVLSSGYFDAYYLQAQKARTLLIREFDKLFAEYNFLISPVSPTPAFKLGENSGDPLQAYLADAMTTPASLAGLPAISLSNGTSRDGLPIGVQIIGKMKADAELLSFAKEVER